VKPGRETPKQAAIRELQEETGLYIANLESMVVPIGVYEGAGRDPRDTKDAWSKSYAFGIILPEEYANKKVSGQDDAEEAKDGLTSNNYQLSHSTIRPLLVMV
jgi:8-oxo-dGTP pyrophosphatase MutT (NUDIX family)